MRAHLALAVKDVQTESQFVQELFDVLPSQKGEDHVRFLFDTPALNLMIESLEGQRASRVSHLGIEVDGPEQVALWVDRLKEKNIEHTYRIQDACCHSLQDQVRFKSPSGHVWEIFYLYRDRS